MPRQKLNPNRLSEQGPIQGEGGVISMHQTALTNKGPQLVIFVFTCVAWCACGGLKSTYESQFSSNKCVASALIHWAISPSLSIRL